MSKKSKSPKELQKNIIDYLNRRNKKKISSLDEMYGEHTKQYTLERYFFIDIAHQNDKPLDEPEILEFIRCSPQINLFTLPPHTYTQLFSTVFNSKYGAPRMSDKAFTAFMNKFVINETEKKINIDNKMDIFNILKSKTLLDPNKIVILIDTLVKCELFTNHNNIGLIKNAKDLFNYAGYMAHQDEENTLGVNELKQKYYAAKEKKNLNNFLKNVEPIYAPIANKSKI